MVHIFTTISQYLILLFMVIYVVDCFGYFTARGRRKRTRNLNVQVFCIFLIHFLCHVCLFLNEDQDYRILVYYAIEILIAILYILFYHKAYRHASRLLTNNVAFLMLIGYTILLRLKPALAIRQFILASVGLVATAFIPLILSRLPRAKDYRYFYGAAGILFLATVLIPGLGQSVNGSSNWISLLGVSLQPMEFVKILFIFFIASVLSQSVKFTNILISAAGAFLFMLILVVENDFGAVFLFYLCYILMLYLATSQPLYAVSGIALMVLAVMVGFVLFRNTLFSHIAVRVAAWRDPFANRDTGGYQLSESLFAIGTGGFTGSGLGRGMPYLIPVAESDFIFSAICEELGMIFGIGLILIYISSFIAMTNVARRCRDPFYKYVTFGIAVTYILQVFLNVGGAVKFIPSTGVTLPLVSYGVSSVFSTLIMFAVVQYTYLLVSREVDEFEDEKERIRKQGRRIVPGSGYPSAAGRAGRPGRGR